MEKKKVGRPRQGKQVKEGHQIRLEDRYLVKILKTYGSLQAWIDAKIAQEFEKRGD